MNHPIYNLDKAIIDYLRPVLGAELREAFLRWDNELGELDREKKELTRQTSLDTASHWSGEKIASQEDLLSGNLIRPAVSDAWAVLMAVATPVQKTLCELYSAVLIELRDLENMELAIQVAETHGSAAYAVAVREIMGLDDIDEPIWWGQ